MTAPAPLPVQPLRVAFFLLGDRNKASSRVRGYWIGEELEALGHQISYHHAQKRWDYPPMLPVMLRHDVLIFQKQYSRYDVALLRLARLCGKRVFFDIDDAPSRAMRKVSQRNAATMMRKAHGVFAGSRNLEALAQEAGGTVHFVPSGVRLENYRITPDRDDRAQVCLGWIGNGAHYVDDLTGILEAPLRTLAARHPLKLKIVGACGEPRLRDVFGVIEGLELELVDQVNWSDPAAVSDAVAEFDIGLYPLIENEFNIYKCAFKALEYMATAIPVVASGVGANGDVITDGADGFLVDTPDDWTARLSQLIEDVEMRRGLGRAGRSKVEERYSTKALARQIAEVM